MAVVMSVEVDESVSERMALLAKHSRFSAEELHRMALERFLDEEIEHLEAILESDRDFEQGRVIPHAEIKSWIDSLRTASPLEVPTSRPALTRRAS